MNGEPASPVCYADQAGDIYMGFAGRDALVEALNALIEAERAGARVIKAWGEAATGPARAVLATLQAEEARWCAMLAAHVRGLGGTPSRKTGGFPARARAIAGDGPRLAFLNAGQGRVVRALDALTPRVRDERLHADLKRMRDAHLARIATMAALIAAQDQPPPNA
jgi:hypothetical protein